MHVSTLASRPADRLAWLWLAIGASLLPFAMFQTVWPFAAWLSPVLLMRFSRTQRLAVGLPLVWLALCLGFAVGWRDDFVPLPLDLRGPQAALLRGGLVVFSAALGVLAYVLDRLLAARLQGVLRTLAFPLAAVTLEYLSSLTLHPVGGLAAYTQYGNLPLMQLASVTGIWGITFLVNWLAPVLNEVWERGTAPRVLRYSLLPFGLVLTAAVVYGSARLTFTPNAPVVRVAGLTPDRTLYLRAPNGEEILWPDLEAIARSSDAERAQWRPRWLQVTDDLLARSRQEARAGAKFVTWAEESAFLLTEDVPSVLEQARAVAREEGVYLQLALQPILRTQQFPFAENRAVLIDPAGNTVWDYHKAYPIPFAESLEYDGGPPVVPFTDTRYGRVAGVICYDTDFLPYMHQAAWAQVGLVLAPANDWLAIKYDHTHEAVYRAVNGFAMMRPDAKGISLAVDPLGRELASADYYTTDRLDIVAMMPIEAVPTLYSRIGDVFAYVSIVLVVILTLLAFVPGLRGRQLGGRPANALYVGKADDGSLGPQVAGHQRRIADELIISIHTAQRHVENILSKLGLGSRTQVAIWAMGQGLVTATTSAAST
jgi:apolipoprotein N-acyltransferase